jgi:hypothetical protein
MVWLEILRKADKKCEGDFELNPSQKFHEKYEENGLRDIWYMQNGHI